MSKGVRPLDPEQEFLSQEEIQDIRSRPVHINRPTSWSGRAFGFRVFMAIIFLALGVLSLTRADEAFFRAVLGMVFSAFAIHAVSHMTTFRSLLAMPIYTLAGLGILFLVW